MPVNLKKFKPLAGLQKPNITIKTPTEEAMALLADPTPFDKGYVPPLRVMGVDVSTDTGIVVLEFDTKMQGWRTVADFEINLPSLPKTCSMRQRVDRCSHLQKSFFQALMDWAPKVIAIEGYSYGHVQTQVTMVEFGMAVRLAFHLEDKGLEVAPASLKKFILGKGVGKKEQVMMQVFKKWGYEAKTNNLADAYVLAHIAAAAYGPYPPALTKPQQEVLKVVKQKNA